MAWWLLIYKFIIYEPLSGSKLLDVLQQAPTKFHDNTVRTQTCQILTTYYNIESASLIYQECTHYSYQ